MLEGFDFTISYAHMAGIKTLRITTAIEYAEGLTIFILDISDAFQNNIFSNTEEMVYISSPHLYVERFKRKCTKYPLASRKPIELCIQAIKSVQRKKLAGKFWYNLHKINFHRSQDDQKLI